jgi:acyl-CoA dehydrogenase
MILLARTTPLAEVAARARACRSSWSTCARPRQRHDGAADREHGQPRDQRAVLREPRDPGENLIGEEGQGFKYILDGLNAERTLIAAECIGDGYWFIDRVVKYASERIVSAARSARTRACSSRSPKLHL